MPLLKKKTIRKSNAYNINIAKRKRRNIKRVIQGKKPLIVPLQIALNAERNSALKKGIMVFFNGKKKIELPLKLIFKAEQGLEVYNMLLQGVYKTAKGRIITVRGEYSTDLMLFELKNRKETLIKSPLKNSKEDYDNFFARGRDLAHMNIDNSLKGQGIGLKIASKTEREQRAKQKGKHKFMIFKESQFPPLFKKLGYSIKKTLHAFTAEKKGKFQLKDDLNKFHRIEAIDPKTGKTKIFTFKVK